MELASTLTDDLEEAHVQLPRQQTGRQLAKEALDTKVKTPSAFST